MLRRLISLVLLLPSLSLHAAEPAGRELAATVLAETGTAAVFAAPALQAALADPHPFLGESGAPRRQRLLEEAGFRAWKPPRAWVLESRREGAVEHWRPAPAVLAARAQARGYHFVATLPPAEAEPLLAGLVPGQAAPAGLAALLEAQGADVLVLVRGREWSLWSQAHALRGSLAQPALLPEVIAESLAMVQQWPAAAGRSVLQVEGVGGIVDLAGVRAALQALPGLRSPQLLRARSDRVWFAVPLEPAVLATALEGEPRLPALATPAGIPGQPAATLQALRLVSPLLRRQWQPAATLPPAEPVASPLLP